MPKPRKHLKSPRSVNRILRNIQAKPLIWTNTIQVEENQTIERQGDHIHGPGSTTHITTGNSTALWSPNTNPENTPLLPSHILPNSIVESPARHGPFGNDSNTTSLKQILLEDYLTNSLSPRQDRDAGMRTATERPPHARLTQRPEPGVYSVGVEVGSGTEPLCAVFNSQAEYSCMLARVAESLPSVTIRNTTPSQRRKWYPTPAGQVYDPQRYAELDLKAFDPYIPKVKLSILLLESDGPIDGVHVYLGGQFFLKLARLGNPLRVRENVGQGRSVGVMDLAISQDGIAEVPVVQSHTTEPFSGGSDPLIIPHFGLQSFSIWPELLSPQSDFQGNTSTKSRLFSDPSCCASTISSFDSTLAPANTMTEFMKNPNDDVFLGYARTEPATHDGDLDSETIDLAILSRFTQNL